VSTGLLVSSLLRRRRGPLARATVSEVRTVIDRSAERAGVTACLSVGAPGDHRSLLDARLGAERSSALPGTASRARRRLLRKGRCASLAALQRKLLPGTAELRSAGARCIVLADPT